MELAHYLRNLLFNNDVVALPGLGSFVTKYKPAEIDKAKKTISPPVKYLIFDSSLSANDHLLARHISLLKNINLEQAENEVSQIIGQLKSRLDSGETVALSEIGYLVKDGGTIRFDRDPETNFLTDSYGLSNVEFEFDGTDFVPHTPVQATKNIKRRSPVLVSLLILLVLIVGAGVYAYYYQPGLIKPYISSIGKFIHDFRNKHEGEIVLRPKPDTTVKQNEIESYYDSTADKKVALSIPSAKKDSVVEKPAPGTKYYIIAGSFKTIAKTKQLAADIKNDGFNVEVIKFDNNLYRISLGVYTDKDVALKELFRIRELKGDNTVWLLTHRKE